MDLGKAQGIKSRDILLRELDWLDSLLAPRVNPSEHPTYAAVSYPAAFLGANHQGMAIKTRFALGESDVRMTSLKPRVTCTH